MCETRGRIKKWYAQINYCLRFHVKETTLIHVKITISPIIYKDLFGFVEPDTIFLDTCKTDYTVHVTAFPLSTERHRKFSKWQGKRSRV